MSILFELLGYEPGRGGSGKTDFIPNIGVGLVGFASDINEFNDIVLHKLYLTSFGMVPDDNSTLVYLKNTMLSKVVPVLNIITDTTPITVYSDTTAYLDNLQIRQEIVKLKDHLKDAQKKLKEIDDTYQQWQIGRIKLNVEYAENALFNKRREIRKREYDTFMGLGFYYKEKEIRLICNKYTYRFAIKRNGVWEQYRSIGNVLKIINSKGK